MTCQWTQCSHGGRVVVVAEWGHPLARAHSRGICLQSPDLRHPAPASCVGLSGTAQSHCLSDAPGANLCPGEMREIGK